MAVRIIEMDKVATIGGNPVLLIPTPFVAVQPAMTPTESSEDSAAFNALTNAVMIEADEDVHVDIGEEPEATTNHPKIAGGSSKDFVVKPGHKVAVRTA